MTYTRRQWLTIRQNKNIARGGMYGKDETEKMRGSERFEIWQKNWT